VEEEERGRKRARGRNDCWTKRGLEVGLCVCEERRKKQHPQKKKNKKKNKKKTRKVGLCVCEERREKQHTHFIHSFLIDRRGICSKKTFERRK
jgi:hypothetical protein